MAPLVQTLQAPLHKMSGPGQCLSMASVAALIQACHSEMHASLVAQSACQQIKRINTDALLSAQLTQCVETMVNAAGTSPAMLVPSLASQMQACVITARELKGQIRELASQATNAEINCMAVHERLADSSKILGSSKDRPSGGSTRDSLRGPGSTAGSASGFANQLGPSPFFPAFGGAGPSGGAGSSGGAG